MSDQLERFEIGARLRSHDLMPIQHPPVDCIEGELVGYETKGDGEYYAIRVTKAICEGFDDPFDARVGKVVTYPLNGRPSRLRPGTLLRHVELL